MTDRRQRIATSPDVPATTKKAIIDSPAVVTPPPAKVGIWEKVKAEATLAVLEFKKGACTVEEFARRSIHTLLSTQGGTIITQKASEMKTWFGHIYAAAHNEGMKITAEIHAKFHEMLKNSHLAQGVLAELRDFNQFQVAEQSLVDDEDGPPPA